MRFCIDAGWGATRAISHKILDPSKRATFERRKSRVMHPRVAQADQRRLLAPEEEERIKKFAIERQRYALQQPYTFHETAAAAAIVCFISFCVCARQVAYFHFMALASRFIEWGHQ